MRCKIFGTICLVLGIIVIVSTGTSFAYFSASASAGEGVINGETMNFDVNLTATPIYKATHIIPLADEYIDDAIFKSTNKCIDSKGYEVCSLYSLTLINSGDAQILNGYVITGEAEKPYITNNLRCQLFDSNYNPISDVTTLSKVVGDKVYLQKTENDITSNVAIEVNNTTKNEVTYYLAIWLHETGELQNDDFLKTFLGNVGFESIYGDKVSVEFSA